MEPFPPLDLAHGDRRQHRMSAICIPNSMWHRSFSFSDMRLYMSQQVSIASVTADIVHVPLVAEGYTNDGQEDELTTKHALRLLFSTAPLINVSDVGRM